LHGLDPFDVEDANLWRKAEYLGRYLFAADFLRQRTCEVVADISCGLGYGTFELCTAVARVIGVDESQEMIEKAAKRNKSPRVCFLRKDLERDHLTPDIAEGSVDAVVSFETLEHLVDPGWATSQFSGILKPGGFLICSVPNVLSESRDSAGLPKNRDHKQWFNFGSLSRMAERNGLRVTYRLGQSWSRAFHRREQQLWNAKRILRKSSEFPLMHSPEMMRWLGYVVAYPTVEDVDGSYSIIIVAERSTGAKF
jgi:SAM-dependent methyltransferase